MRALARAGAAATTAATVFSWLCSETNAAIVEAGTLTAITVEAPLYDTNLSAANGCDPAGCVGDLTRDGDLTSLGSRWACKPALGSADSTCSIMYSLAESLILQGLNIAMYKGDSRTRTMEVYVDGEMYTTWTSSGTTSAFETVNLDTNGQTVELRGVLEDSEWVSVMEVEILVDDGADSSVVEAGTLGTVTTASSLYDTNLSTANGCDPVGCTASLTRDNDMAQTSRWSCSPNLGGMCAISYELGATRDISELRLAMYKGDTRTRTMEVYVNEALVTTWTSSGTTDSFESIDLSGMPGEIILLVGVLEDSEWISIVETEIMVLSDGVTPPTPAPVSAPTPAPVAAPVQPTAPVQPSVAVEAGTLGAVTSAAALYDTSLSTANGCDPAGCTASLTRDGDLSQASRWSCAPKLGGACTISYDLGAARDLRELRLAMYKGTTRTTTMDVYVDGNLILTWTSSGTTDALQTINLPGMSGELIEVTGVLADSEWISIVEAEIMVLSDEIAPPSPTPTPVSPPVQPVTPNGDLEAVGLIPLATGDEWDIERFYVKDGDFSTSWSCTGDPRDPDQTYISYDCSLSFRLFSKRHIKQVKIALTDGANGPVDMRIATYPRSELNEIFVTSSGTTDGFETYAFDHYTERVSISAVFTTAQQSISISEVEFMEEVQAGVLRVTSFSTPSDIGEASEEELGWTSDSEEALGETVTFELESYAAVTAIEIEFPVGDTYKFDLTLYTGETDWPNADDPFITVTDWESTDTEGWQSFDLDQHLSADEVLTKIDLIIKGTGSGAPGFTMLDARIIGTVVDNPSDTFYVATAYIEEWTGSSRYPDFVGEGTGDQKAIMGAICAIKKATFDGVDCVGEDATATGTLVLPMGNYYVDGNIFMKSGVYIDGRSSIDDSPYTTEFLLEDGAAGKTEIGAILVLDGVSDARVEDIWIAGLYDSETSNSSPAVDGLGSTCLSITDSKNITLKDLWIDNCDGDAVVVTNSDVINIDASGYDDEYKPYKIGSSRGTGLVVDTCTDIWVRRHNMYDNGVAGIHISGSNNFTFEATQGSDEEEGEGNVGSLDGQQPIEIIIESSNLVTFQDMKVTSSNEPVMTISADCSEVSFDNCGFSSVLSGTCVIQTEDPSVVTVEDDELSLEGTCYIKI